MLSQAILGVQTTTPRIHAMTTKAERIKKAIHRSGLNMSEVARRIGIRPQALSQATRNGYLASENLSALAKCTGVTTEWLINGGDVLEAASMPDAPPLISWDEAARTKMKSFRLALSSGAMAPHLPDGSTITVDASPPENGDYVVATVDGGAPVVREFQSDGSTIVLRPACKDFSSFCSPPSAIKIIGVVTGMHVDFTKSRKRV